MAKGKRVGTALCAILALAVVGSVAYVVAAPNGKALGDSPAAQFLALAVPEPPELTHIEPPTARPPVAEIGETYMASGYEVKVQDIRVGKTRGPLPLVPETAMHLGRDEHAQLDENGTFQDDHLYVDVNLTIHNVSYDDDFLIGGCVLYSNSENGVFPGGGSVASDLADLTAPGHDSGNVSIAIGESVSGHIGFVVTEDQLLNEEEPLYFTVDVKGLVEGYPEDADTSWTPVPTEWS